MHKARVDCFCFFFAGTSGLVQWGGKGQMAVQLGGSPAGAGTGGSPAGAGAEGPKRGRRLPSRSKATPSIIFEFIGMVTSFLVCNGSIAGNAPPQGRSLNLVTPLEKQFNQYYGNMAECKLILKRAIMW